MMGPKRDTQSIKKAYQNECVVRVRLGRVFGSYFVGFWIYVWDPFQTLAQTCVSHCFLYPSHTKCMVWGSRAPEFMRNRHKTVMDCKTYRFVCFCANESPFWRPLGNPKGHQQTVLKRDGTHSSAFTPTFSRTWVFKHTPPTPNTCFQCSRTPKFIDFEGRIGTTNPSRNKYLFRARLFLMLVIFLEPFIFISVTLFDNFHSHLIFLICSTPPTPNTWF